MARAPDLHSGGQGFDSLILQMCIRDSVCTMGRIFPTEGSYKLRLNVTQVSSGRHFYSNEVDVKLIAQASVLGAMVLHGDGNASDIGIVAAKEFQLAPPSGTFVEQILPCYYSEQNGGAKIDGKGISIIQKMCIRDSFGGEY